MIWKHYIGPYEVSDEGQIRNARTGRVRKLKRLPPWGYLQVTLYVDRRPRYVYVHQAVLETFVGPRPTGMQARHLDGNRTNNTVGNLAWGTPKENAADTELHGRVARGNRLPQTKLSEAQVWEILRADGLQREIADRFGVSRQLVGKIKRREHRVVAKA